MTYTSSRWVAAALVAGLWAAPAPGHAASGPRLDLCQRQIMVVSDRLEEKIHKALRSCIDLYRGAVLAGQSGGELADEADHCEKKLQKAIVLQGAEQSAMDDAFYDLLASTDSSDGACGMESSVGTLGHLRNIIAGDRWIRLALVRAYQHAVQEVLGDVRDMPVIFKALYDADGGQSCPNCKRYFGGGECALHTCRLGGSSNMCIDGSTVFSQFNAGGVVPYFVCRIPDIMYTDFAVVSAPSNTIIPIDWITGTLCLRSVDAEGLIGAGTGVFQQVSLTTCIDHKVGGANGLNQCFGTNVFCDADAPDPIHSGTTNGGLCFHSTSPPSPASGHAIVAQTFQLEFVLNGQEGADGIACTSDDLSIPEPPLSLVLTTASANAVIHDADNTSGANLPSGVFCPVSLSGTPFDYSALAQGVLSGGKLVGMWPQLHDPLLASGDSVTSVVLECQ